MYELQKPKTSIDMEFPKLLLHIGLILATDATVTDFCVADDPDQIHRLPNNSIPVDYNISLIIPDLEKSNTFEIIVTVDIVYSSSYISFHSQGLEINKTATTLMNNTITYKPTERTYDHETNILSLHFEKQLYRGFYTLNMKFAGNFSHIRSANPEGNGGFIKIPYTDEEENRKYNKTESEVVYDDSKDPTFQRRKVASLVAHEIAHQWLGNFITPSWWLDLWLSEGFAEFFQVYFLNKTFEDWRSMDFFVTGTMHDSLNLDDGLLDSVTLNLHDTLNYDRLEDLIINLMDNSTAYCRVYYDILNLERIIHYLNSEEYTEIHVLNRAQILDDAFAFVLENQLDNSVFMNLISYLGRERDYMPWHTMFRIITRIVGHFILPESDSLKKPKTTSTNMEFSKLLLHISA